MSDLWADYRPSGHAPNELVPVFGIRPFTPGTMCQDVHPHGPIPTGSRCCCMACHQSGVDHMKMEGDPVGWAEDPNYPAQRPSASAITGGHQLRRRTYYALPPDTQAYLDQLGVELTD